MVRAQGCGSAGTKKINNYFDGLPVSKSHLFLFVIIVFSYFFDQMNNNNFGFVAPALIKCGFATKQQIATIAFGYFIGMTLGGYLGGIISDIFGRKKTFLGAIVIFSSMSLLNGLTDSFEVFAFARAATGFGLFMMMVVSFAYISEMSPSENRGKWQSMSAAFGFLAMPAIGLISRVIIPMGPYTWRYIYYLGALGLISFVLGLFFLKESPRWLVGKGRVAEAERVIEELTGVAVDLSEAAKNIPPKIGFFEQVTGMFRDKYMKRTLVLLGIGTPIALGSYVFAVWTPTLFAMKGFSIEDSLTVGLALMCGGPVGLFISSFFSDKGGRKIPLAIGCVLWAALMALFVQLGNNFVWTCIAAFLVNAVTMAVAFINFPYIAEHYPTSIRNTAVGTVNAIQRLLLSFSQLAIPLLVAGLGIDGFYLLVAVIIVIPTIIVMTAGMSTGGKSLEEVS